MKKYSEIINIVLLLAVAVLYFLHFTGDEDTDNNVRQPYNIPVQQSGSSGPTIVYVNVDSLLINYLLYSEMADQLVNTKSNLENELSRKSQVFDKEVMDFQTNVSKGFVTRKDQAEIENQLGIKQQILIALKDSMASQLIISEQEMNTTLHNNIISEIEEFNKMYNYQFVLSKTFGGSILFGNNNLNITKVILDRLNEKHSKKK